MQDWIWIDLDSYALCVSAAPSSVARVLKWYWYGERRFIPTKNAISSTICLALENHSMMESDYGFIGAILSVRCLDAAATTTISLQETDVGTPYFPETPWGFRGTLFASATTERLLPYWPAAFPSV
jgi:hypothetical protein